MFYPKKLIVPVFVCAVLAGVGLHFLYARFPCTLSALLSPVCESLWEHIKILYWPYLAVMAFGFWFPVRFSGPFRGWRWRIPAILAFLLGALILLFTFFPPAGVLFADLS